jgi:hypothetical protein
MNRLRGIAILCGAALLLWPALRIKAFNPQPDPPAFGPVGIDPFATARLNAVCADGPLPGGVAPGPCDVTLTFRDANGLTLQQMHATLAPGQVAHLDQRAAAVAFGGRTEVQPFILPTGHGFVLATVEVFDNFTGRTLALLGPTEPKSLGTSSAAGQ